MRKITMPITGIKSNQTLPCLKLVLCAWLWSYGQKLSLVYLHNGEPDCHFSLPFLQLFFFSNLASSTAFFLEPLEKNEKPAGVVCVCGGPFPHD